MEKESVFRLLFFEPERFFIELKNRRTSLRDLIISFVIVILSSLTNVASALYLHKEVTHTFLLYVTLVGLIMWFVFSSIVFLLSKGISTANQKSFPTLLYGMGISRTPVVIFVCIQFTSLFGKYKINATSMPFLMIYIIVVLWMFYLYITCIEKLFNLSIGKSVLIVILAFVAVLIITIAANTALNVSAIYF